MGGRQTVLVVDGRPERAAGLAEALDGDGFDVRHVPDGLQALRHVLAEPVDVVMARCDLPVVGAAELCRRLRAAGEAVPVLVLGERRTVEQLECALEAGADDYVGEPASLREVRARLRALHRRSTRVADACRELEYGDLRLDRRRRRAWRGERRLALTPTEMVLLEHLLLHPGEVLERAQLRLRVWGYDGDSNSLGVFVGRLRQKLEQGGEPRVIWTVRGVGFLLDLEDPAIVA